MAYKGNPAHVDAVIAIITVYDPTDEESGSADALLDQVRRELSTLKAEETNPRPEYAYLRLGGTVDQCDKLDHRARKAGLPAPVIEAIALVRAYALAEYDRLKPKRPATPAAPSAPVVAAWAVADDEEDAEAPKPVIPDFLEGV